MELTVREIVSASQALNILSTKKKIKKQKVFYWLTVTPPKIKTVVESFEKIRGRLLEELTFPDPDNDTQRKFPDDLSRKTYNDELNSFADGTEEVPVKTIKLSLLFAEEGLELTPDLVLALGPMVENDLENEEKEDLGVEEEE